MRPDDSQAADLGGWVVGVDVHMHLAGRDYEGYALVAQAVTAQAGVFLDQKLPCRHSGHARADWLG